MKKYVITFAFILLFIIIVTSIVSSMKTETFTEENIRGLDNPNVAAQTPNSLTAYSYLKDVKKWNIDSLEPHLKYIVFSMRALVTYQLGNVDFTQAVFQNAVVIPHEHLLLYDINVDPKLYEPRPDNTREPTVKLEDINYEFTLTGFGHYPQGLIINVENISFQTFKRILIALDKRLNKEFHELEQQLIRERNRLQAIKKDAENENREAQQILQASVDNFNNTVSVAKQVLAKASIKEDPPNGQNFEDYFQQQLVNYQKYLSDLQNPDVTRRCTDVWNSAHTQMPTSYDKTTGLKI
jgi:hypothetical protein